ncbi:MAG: endonuclease/exonuclease/phosphatase family protein [Bacteroidetes bacterium]|nr:endonuclease/exonuclease/phosphatase family protein [Bacteroidota bacterium]
MITALLVAVLSKYISPLLFWLPAFFGLAFPYLFLLNLLFIIYWFIQFKHPFVFGLIAALLSVTTAYRYVQFSSDESASAKSIKVTSYNCMLFDLYNWSKNKEARSSILGSLSDINPDILCLQEFYTSEEPGDYNNIDTVKKMFGISNYHVEFTTTLRGFDHWGIATFSKYPIVNQGKIIFNTRTNNICIFTDVLVNHDTIRVYNLHLQSISFSKQDNKFLEDVISDKDAEDEMEKSKNILRRLKRAFVKRTRQVEMIALHMKTCRHRIILCGDFNDTAASFAYQKLSGNLKDAFIEKGNGFGRTYAGKWPQFRIDYILHDKRLKCLKYQRYEETFTDHFPITAFFKQ